LGEDFAKGRLPRSFLVLPIYGRYFVKRNAEIADASTNNVPAAGGPYLSLTDINQGATVKLCASLAPE